MTLRTTIISSASRLPAGTCDRIISSVNAKFNELFSHESMRPVYIGSLTASFNYYIEHMNDFSVKDETSFAWLFGEHRGKRQQSSTIPEATDALINNENDTVIEVGPRLTFATANSTNIQCICRVLGVPDGAIRRVERSVTYRFSFTSAVATVVGDEKYRSHVRQLIISTICDPVTETVFGPRPLVLTNEVGKQRRSFSQIEIMHGSAKDAAKIKLQDANNALRLGFDDQDVEFYATLFFDKLQRNPTDVELLDLSQSNSEHSRHWFFKGRLVIDGQEMPSSLLKEIMDTTAFSNSNNIIKFCDNSSGIVGFPITQLKFSAESSENQQVARRLVLDQTTRHIIFTAETHNFPTAVEPFSGATTGTGGRIRDVQACGRGAHVIAGTAGYCFGNLTFPSVARRDDDGDKAENIQSALVWQNDSYTYPSNFAAPLKIAIEASNGASDYGNKFGEPVICGFARSFGGTLADSERCEWIKPIMFSGGIGSIEHIHVHKSPAQPGMAVVKLGGPAYPIGVGGGAASSVQVQGARHMSLHDMHAVQRGDAQMEQKVNRVLRACIEQLENNPIRSIHDQGAGGNANVLKEIIAPCGADIYADQFQLGDRSMSIGELWIAEYQENLAVLLDAGDIKRFEEICLRERCPFSVVGTTNDSDAIVLHDFKSRTDDDDKNSRQNVPVCLPVCDLVDVESGGDQRKTFQLTRNIPLTTQKSPSSSSMPVLSLSELHAALDRILLLPSVASKRWLTNKVERSVTGLIVQQQCVGPWHTPLADYALIALSEFPVNVACNQNETKIFRGAATAIGEQPIKTTLDPARGARLTVAEALSNLVFCCITDLADVKCSGNWMWPAKLPGEGAKLYDACISMCNFMRQLHIAVDGGKDSLSMAAQIDDDNGQTTVKAPDALVISAYAPCPNIYNRVTPEFKHIGSKILLVCVSDIFGLKGSSYAHAMQLLNDDDGAEQQMSDVEPDILACAFRATQQCIEFGRILAGHDVSDGGLLVCLLEMCFASNNIAFDVDLSTLAVKTTTGDALDQLKQLLFGEPVAWILEVANEHVAGVCDAFARQCQHKIIIFELGSTVDAEKTQNEGPPPFVRYSAVKNNNNQPLFELFNGRSLNELRMQWERMSFALESQQSHWQCVESERKQLFSVRRVDAPYKVQLDLTLYSNNKVFTKNYRVGVVREEGTNGDRELAVAFQMAGFDVWDITMSDFMSVHGGAGGGSGVDLDAFNGLAFAGGFSFGDVCGSARGWAAEFKFNERLRRQLRHFTHERRDTFTLGICNGCQLMCLLDLINTKFSSSSGRTAAAIELHENMSGRFESRFATVHIPSTTRAVMLQTLRGSTLGVWVAHHEGRFCWPGAPQPPTLDELQPNLALQYVDINSGTPTQVYPHNPNGSPHALAGLCSSDGRHLALMPHPERGVLDWQWPWMSQAVEGSRWQSKELKQASSVVQKIGLSTSPWLLMFESAKCWLQTLTVNGDDEMVDETMV